MPRHIFVYQKKQSEKIISHLKFWCDWYSVTGQLIWNLPIKKILKAELGVILFVAFDSFTIDSYRWVVCLIEKSQTDRGVILFITIPYKTDEEIEIPKKWIDWHSIFDSYAFPASDGDFSFAPPIIIRNFILGTFVRAKPCKKYNTPNWPTINYIISLRKTRYENSE